MFSNLSIERKTLILGAAMAAPLFLMAATSALMFAGIDLSAKRANEATMRTERYFAAIEQLDRIRLIQAKIARIAAAAAPTRFEPYTDEPLYAEYDEAKKEFDAAAEILDAFVTENANVRGATDAAISRWETAQAAFAVAESLKRVFTEDMRRTLAEASDVRVSYEDSFLRLESLTAYYESSLRRIEGRIVSKAEGNEVREKAAGALALGRTAYIDSARISFSSRANPYIDEGKRNELTMNAEIVEDALREIDFAAEDAAEYEAGFRSVRAVAETELPRVLEEWTAARGKNELSILRTDKTLEELSDGIFERMTSLSVSLRTELSAESEAKNTAQKELLARAAGNLILAFALGLISLGAIFLLTKLFAISISGPIGEAAAFADAVRNGNARPHMGTARNDEIGVLVRALESMAAEIERKTGALEDSKNFLEQRVEIRTAHLESALDKLAKAQELLVIEEKFWLFDVLNG